MKIIACVDDAFGMMFNKRRQSKDSLVRKKILDELQGKKLWMNAYSEKQFVEENFDNICVDEEFMLKAETEDYCFLENISALPFKDRITEITLFKWNRKYPSDFKFDIPLQEAGWQLIQSEEFAGSSHEKITKEVYVK